MHDGPIHDDDGHDDPWPTGRVWRVRTPELDRPEGVLNALEDAGYYCSEPVRLEDSEPGIRFLVTALFDPADLEPDEDDEAEDDELAPRARPLPDATCEQG